MRQHIRAKLLGLFFLGLGTAVGQSDLAVGRPVTVSSIQSGAREYAVDGNPQTFWESSFNDNQWLYVDLGRTYAVNRVFVDWGEQASEKYQIKYKVNEADPWIVITEQTGVADHQDVFTSFAPVEARYVKVWSTKRTNNDCGLKVNMFTVFGTGLMDLAVGSPVTVSSTQSGAKENAVDENPITLWESTFNNNQWIYVDLGQSYPVSKVFVDWGEQASEKYQIKYKLNETDPWIVITEQTGVADYQDVATAFPTVNARYVKVYSTKRTNNDWGLKVQSLKVFGTGSVNSDQCFKIKSRKDNRYLKQLETGKGIVPSGATAAEGDAFCLTPVSGKFKIFRNGTYEYWKRDGANEDRIAATATSDNASQFHRQPCFYAGQANRYGFMDPEDDATHFLKAHDVGQSIATYNSAACDKSDEDSWEGFFLEPAGQANHAPQASNVTLEGEFRVGGTLACNYAYADADGDAEGTPGYQWFSSVDAAGNAKIQLPGAVGKQYLIGQADFGRYLSCEVKPQAATGYSPGMTVSNPTPYPGPVLETSVPPLEDMLAWKYSKPIRFNTATSGAFISGDVTAFPVLIRLDDGNFDFTQADKAGKDLRFEFLGQPLNYEIEAWDFKNKAAAIWVLMPVIQAKSTLQNIMMRWGNPAAPEVSISEQVV